MPHNLLKKYNDLLDIIAMSDGDKNRSLLGVFNRDIRHNANLKFRTKQVHPTPNVDDEIKFQNLFSHLTKKVIDKTTNHRELDLERACRLHWIKFHIEERKNDNMLLFSVQEPKGIRTYIYDVDEKYVIILEPLRNKTAYYLLTAYYVEGKDDKRNKFLQKYKRRLAEIA